MGISILPIHMDPQASHLVHPGSAYTAAVQDIEDGLQDMAVGTFWVTGERLKMAPFTVPLCKNLFATAHLFGCCSFIQYE